MADMKQVIQAIDANGKVQTVYKKIVDLGGGLYADAVAVNIDTVTVTDVGIKDQVSGNSAGVDVDGNLQVKGDVTATLNGSKACLSTEAKPAGVQNDTLLEYNVTTKETKVYKYITGQWREI